MLAKLTRNNSLSVGNRLRMFNERNPKVVKGLGIGLAVTGGALAIVSIGLIGGLGFLGYSSVGPAAGASLFHCI